MGSLVGGRNAYWAVAQTGAATEVQQSCTCTSGGTWFQMSASTPVDYLFVGFHGYWASAGVTAGSMTLAVALGASGSERILGLVNFQRSNGTSDTTDAPGIYGRELTVPILIPAGSRLAGRFTATGGGAPGSVNIYACVIPTSYLA